ncbi:MAG: DUF4260 domain-containing protein [Acidocella sp.]|nr:DUF4260 domain-containing protein [Acidocella sp.]
MEVYAVRGVPLILLRLEGAVVLAASVLAYIHTGQSWWLFAILFLTPDLSMLGYLANPKIGAVAYNAVHSYIAPLLLGMAGVLTRNHLVLALAVIWTGHIGFDRVLGYGLKFASGFRDTHLGRIGRVK